jgi:hypothetical protein
MYGFRGRRLWPRYYLHFASGDWWKVRSIAVRIACYVTKIRTSCLCTKNLKGLPLVSTGAGFPMHLYLDVVHCASPMEFQISRHTLSAPALCTAYLPKNSGSQLSPLSVSKVDSAMLAPSFKEQWYLTYSPFRSNVDIALASSIYQRTVVPNSSPFLSKADE